jgi:NADPH:quinone reductase-like Zn-dependent oxidoreductase
MSGANIPNANIGAILFKRLQIIGTTLRARDEEYQGHLLSRFEKEALPSMKKGGVEVRIHEVFDWKDVQKSHEMMEVRLT